jgi:subtilisin family serine protease
MKLRAIPWVLTTLGLVGCGSHDLIGQRQRREAPRGERDVGVLFSDAQEKDLDSILEEHPNARVRVLNRSQGMYEIFGVKAEEIENRLGLPAQENEYFRLDQRSNLFSMPTPVGLQLPGMARCRGALEIPTAKLEVSGLARVENGGTVEAGQAIKINTTGSRAANSFPSPIKRTLILNGPQVSQIQDLMTTSETYEFTPDALGVYQALVVVQDSRDVCSMDGTLFVVTANRPYVGKNAKDVNIDLDMFKQLSAVHAADAWKTSEGKGITIAIIDTGVNYNHPSLAPNIDVNEREIPGDGIDNDKNNLEDDFIGYDFVNGDGYAYDDDAHGTHVAGIAASRQFGLARKASILPIKALTTIGGDIGSIAAAIVYAVERGARVINLSLGAPAKAPHPLLMRAVAYAEKKGVIIVAAAGNGDPATGLGFSVDVKPVFPASLDNENVIGVASSETTGMLAPSSNFGRQSVEVIAPGGHMPLDPIFSTAFENPTNNMLLAMSGTSMAAPVVSGIVADALSANPRLTIHEIREILLAAGEPSKDLATVSASGRIIDAAKVVELALLKNVLF